MKKTSTIAGFLCLVVFIYFLTHPSDAETTAPPTGMDFLFLLWLAVSVIVILYGLGQLFLSGFKFRRRVGHLLPVTLALPGIIYIVYALCTDA